MFMYHRNCFFVEDYGFLTKNSNNKATELRQPFFSCINRQNFAKQISKWILTLCDFAARSFIGIIRIKNCRDNEKRIFVLVTFIFISILNVAIFHKFDHLKSCLRFDLCWLTACHIRYSLWQMISHLFYQVLYFIIVTVILKLFLLNYFISNYFWSNGH